MFPNEFVLQQHRRDMQKEAEYRTLARIATGGAPSLWQRVIARLSLPQVKIEAPSVRVAIKNPTEALA